MADPYQQRARAYAGNVHGSYSRTTRPPQPSPFLTRSQSCDNGDDDSYLDGGTGVSRRLSVIQQQQLQHQHQYQQNQLQQGQQHPHHHQQLRLQTNHIPIPSSNSTTPLRYISPPPPGAPPHTPTTGIPPPPLPLPAGPPINRRTSVVAMSERPPSPGGFFAVTPGGNGSPYMPPYSPVFSAGHDGFPSNAPYPPTPGGGGGAYNGGGSPPPSHQPYNPSAYQPQRQASTAGAFNHQQQAEYRPQRQASTASYVAPPGASSYDPNLYTTPYPSTQSYRAPAQAQPALSMPSAAGAARYSYSPQMQQQQYVSRPQYPTGSHSTYMSPTVPYSPGLPPVPSQSAPPHNGYQPPPPPPPPHPPGSPAFAQAPYPHHSPSQSSMSYGSHYSRQETHYHSGSDSDVSAPTEPDTPHHPLPSPPKERSLSYRDHMYPGGSPALPSSPPPPPPAHGHIARHQSQSRPLPQVPNGGGDEELYGDIEASLQDMGSGAMAYSDSSAYSHRRNGTNGRIDSVYDYYGGDNDSDPPVGMEAESDRRGSLSSQPLPPPREDDSDLDYMPPSGVDMGMIGGDFFSDGGYGGFSGLGLDNNVVPNPLPPVPAAAASPPPPPQQQQANNDLYNGGLEHYFPGESDLHPFPVFGSNAAADAAPEFASNARVDTFGTGGLAPPTKRLSFEEGDDDFDHASDESPTKRSSTDDDFPELFYHPGSFSANPQQNSRPLPSLPGYEFGDPSSPAGTGPSYARNYQQQQMPGSQPQSARLPPASPSLYGQMNLGAQQPYIPRTASLTSHPSQPSTVAPVRSKTDGKVHKANRTSMIVPGNLGLPESEVASGLTPSDLPAIPLSRKFDPKKLSTKDFRRCAAPWALSKISTWLKEMTEGELDLKEALVADAVAALFTHFVPTMNVADAETLATKVVSGMLKEKNLIKEEEWVKFGSGEVSGVIYQITGSGCYSSKLHEYDSPARCYAHHCARTLRKITLPHGGAEVTQRKEDWATHWKIKKEQLVDVNKKEIERQNNLHEVVQTEEEFMEHMEVLKVVYRDQILVSNIIKPNRLENFVRDVFGKADAVRKVSEEHLLPQLKFRQREQGPWIVGFSDIFREWIRKAKVAYLDYAAAFPNADMLVRREAERNMLFREFLDKCRQDPRARRLDWVTFLKGPITRLQRYSLLLATVLKHTTIDSEEKHNLERAIEEIKAVTHDCDARVDEMSKRVQLMELDAKLVMRQWPVDLRAGEKGRELIFKGDLQRTGNNRFTWLETHAILFDHYLVLAKTMMQKEVAGGAKQERYDVSRMPIPMDLLVLESTNDDPVIRNAANRLGIAGPATTTKDTARGRHNSAVGVPTLSHTNTSSSISSTATAPGRLVTNIPDMNARDDRVLYPFRIKHLGNPTRVQKTDDNTYILYAPSAANRKDWCDKIILAKEKHAASLHAQNAEPFRLNVMADCAFGYDSAAAAAQPKPIKIRGTPLDRAISEVEKRYDGLPKPPAICKASVNCATAFTAQYGREMVAIGTDFGVFTAEANNPRGWTRVINAVKVTQIAVIEEFSLFLILADKALVAYHLDVVVPLPGAAAGSATKQKAPQKLSGAKDVGFFATGRMKERTLVFYKKREGLSSTFKVLEPVFQKATEKKSRFARKGTTEFFREFDEFYIPTDCYGINLFHSSLAVHTSKGFEVMTLDKKQAWSVPELRAGSHVDDIASRLSGEKPLGMFRLSEIEFLLCYEECAVYVNKHGDVSRSVVMEFVGKAMTVAMYGPYVLVFDQDFVEIRNAQNGRLRQVISGRDVRCLDDAMGGGTAPGSKGGRSVKVAMAHPEIDGRQLVVELVLNEGQRD